MRHPALVSFLVGTAVCVAAAIPTVAIAATPVHATSSSVSARTLLDHLTIAKEAHSSTYSTARFGGWIDADRDGEDTRTEVLRAESSRSVTVSSSGAVTAGTWVSPYDGRTATAASKVGVDHLVPLQEAWVSGAASWTAAKRAAFADDLGHAAELVVVSKKALHAKGSKEPTAYLPAAKSYRCTYVKNWIAAKQRWGLSIDPAEQRALARGLTKYCASTAVTKPGAPDLAALVGSVAQPVAKPVATAAPILPTTPAPVVTVMPTVVPVPVPVATTPIVAPVPVVTSAVPVAAPMTTAVPVPVAIPAAPVATTTPPATAVPVVATPTSAPAPVAAPVPVASSSAYYANCTEVRNAGKAPLSRSDPGYSSKLDRDGDGVACE